MYIYDMLMHNMYTVYTISVSYIDTLNKGSVWVDLFLLDLFHVVILGVDQNDCRQN